MDGALTQLADFFTTQTKETLATELGNGAAGSLPQLCPILVAQLYSYLKSGNYSADFLRKLYNTPEFSVSRLGDISAGGLPQLLSAILNNHTSETIEAIASSLNINKEKAISLLSVAGSIVLGIAGKYLRNRTAQSISLVGWLETQLPELRAAAPGTLGQGKAAPAATATVAATTGAATSAAAPAKRRKIWPWILLIVLLLLAFLLLRSCGSSAPATQASAPAPSAQPADDASTWSLPKLQLGEFFKKQLPNDVTLDIPQNGIENHLIAHIESGDPVSKDLWFSFDRLVFKTNSAQLEPQSEEQLNNIANILRAWDKVKIKLGGYTDNTGTEEFNMKLSQQRADSVRLSLIERGVSPERVTAEGYGSAHPVVPNDSAENRARNRRIDINVTEK
ncbi:OmpA family protein [Enterobacteriaceae bacterium 4M9]|nr:OmpA family protein [Enterobacteriaceae bacterium 4M9]